MNTMVRWLAVLPALLLAGCLSNPTNMEPETYNAGEAQRAVSIRRGVVLSVEEVQVKEKGTQGATAVGSIAGAGLGYEVGGGRGRQWATAAGALLGGMAGEKLTQYNEKAYAYIVELQQGGTIQVVQQGPLIAPNSAVFVKYLSGGRTVLQEDTSQGQIYDRTGDTHYRQ